MSTPGPTPWGLQEGRSCLPESETPELTPQGHCCQHFEQGYKEEGCTQRSVQRDYGDELKLGRLREPGEPVQLKKGLPQETAESKRLKQAAGHGLMAESQPGRGCQQTRLQKAGTGVVMETLLRYILMRVCERYWEQRGQPRSPKACALQIHGGEGRILCSAHQSPVYLSEFSDPDEFQGLA